MRGPILGFRAWQVAKPTRRGVREEGALTQISKPYAAVIARTARAAAPGLAAVPELDAWFASHQPQRRVRLKGRLHWDFDQPEQEPGTLQPIGWGTGGSTWAKPGPVQMTCEHHQHARPERDCTCGLYAWLSMAELLERGAIDPGQVCGAIIAWGHLVIHGVEGFRAEHARIVALSPPLPRSSNEPVVWKWAKLAAERLGVPCVPLHRLEEVGREFGNPIRWEYRFE